MVEESRSPSTNSSSVEDGEPAVRLSEVEQGEKRAGEIKRKQPRRMLRAMLSLLALIIIAGAGGYVLLRVRVVELKADRPLSEKVSSGNDIREAAYASLRESLDAPSSPTPSVPGPLATPPAMTGTEDLPSRERIGAPVEPGIADTLASPPGSGRANAAAPAGDSQHRADERTASPGTSLSNVSIRSVRFAAIPRSASMEKIPDMISMPPVMPAVANTGKPTLQVENIPRFGAMLPVRLMGAVFTLRSGSLVRLELMRDLQTEHWQMKRGTIFIGNVLGSGADRAFVQVKGFIDQASERFLKIEGEVLGDDGGAGLRGRTRRVSSLWGRVLDRAAHAGLQIATSVLNRGASSVIVATDPYGTIRAGGDRSADATNNRSFVEVAAGATGFILVTSLPPAMEERNPYLAENLQAGLSEIEWADLITSADPERLRAAMPKLPPELRPIIEQVIRQTTSMGK